MTMIAQVSQNNYLEHKLKLGISNNINDFTSAFLPKGNLTHENTNTKS